MVWYLPGYCVVRPHDAISEHLSLHFILSDKAQLQHDRCCHGDFVVTFYGMCIVCATTPLPIICRPKFRAATSDMGTSHIIEAISKQHKASQLSLFQALKDTSLCQGQTCCFNTLGLNARMWGKNTKVRFVWEEVT